MATALTLLLCSCSNVSEVYRDIEQDVAQGEYRHAIARIRSNQNIYGAKAHVLYCLDLGLLYHYAGMPDSSDAYLFSAEREIQDLYTQSVSLGVLSVLTNDNILPYDGEDHERVLINLFLALNYAEQGNTEEALVEARKVDLKLREFSRKYEGKNTYQDDAFIRFVTGVLYENDGETNDAFIAYRQSHEAYQRYLRDYGTVEPRTVLDDIVRTARSVGFGDEAVQYGGAGGTDSLARPGDGSILVVAYAGKGPIKEEIRTTVSIPDTGGTLHTFQIALPKIVPRMRHIRAFNVEILNPSDSSVVAHSTTVLAEDITAIAAKCLDDRLSLVYLKSGGRAVLKFLAAEKAKSELKKKDDSVLNFLGSLAVDLVVGATEQADLRAWGTLPAQISAARIRVPAGGYIVKVRADDGGFAIPGDRVTVERGKTAFVIVDDIR